MSERTDFHPYPLPQAYFDTVQITYRINGIDYRRCGYYGCQLESIETEWKTPSSNRRHIRKILGWTFEGFTYEKVGFFKRRIAWMLKDIRKNPRAGAIIASFYDNLTKAD